VKRLRPRRWRTHESRRPLLRMQVLRSDQMLSSLGRTKTASLEAGHHASVVPDSRSFCLARWAWGHCSKAGDESNAIAPSLIGADVYRRSNRGCRESPANRLEFSRWFYMELLRQFCVKSDDINDNARVTVNHNAHVTCVRF
jgi:hypothetical protein